MRPRGWGEHRASPAADRTTGAVAKPVAATTYNPAQRNRPAAGVSAVASPAAISGPMMKTTSSWTVSKA